MSPRVSPPRSITFDNLDGPTAELAEKGSLQRAVDEAEQRVSAGDTISHEEVVAEIDRWIARERS